MILGRAPGCGLDSLEPGHGELSCLSCYGASDPGRPGCSLEGIPAIIAVDCVSDAASTRDPTGP